MLLLLFEVLLLAVGRSRVREVSRLAGSSFAVADCRKNVANRFE